jgi:hypothetical protein
VTQKKHTTKSRESIPLDKDETDGMFLHLFLSNEPGTGGSDGKNNMGGDIEGKKKCAKEEEKGEEGEEEEEEG